MSLLTYEDVRPWARSIKHRTGLGSKMDVMPPWFIERNIGIQQYKDDMSLTEKEIATIAAWVDAGAPRGNAEDMPPAKKFAGGNDPTKGYSSDARMIVPHVDGSKFQIALLLRPTPLPALEELGKHDEVMPQKSTYFFPKLATGMIVNPLK